MGLQDNHRHTGRSDDGPPVHARNIDKLHQTIFFPAMLFDHSNANVDQIQSNGHAMIDFNDAATGIANMTFEIPAFKRGISSLKIVFYNTNASSDLYLTLASSLARLGDAAATDTSTAVAAYTTGAAVNTFDSVLVPKSVYDGLISLKGGDIFSLKVTRFGAHASDTYNAQWLVLGVLVEFS